MCLRFDLWLWIDYFRELDTTNGGMRVEPCELWIDYFRELDTTRCNLLSGLWELWIDYFRELDTTTKIFSKMLE